MTKILIIKIILLSVCIGIYFYPQFPDTIVSHWNAQGQPDDYMSKFWGLFLLPLILAAMAVLFLIIPKIDPLKENIEKFRKYYENFILLMVLFMFYIYSLTIIWNLGIKFDMNRVLLPAFAILFYFCGVLVEKAKRNYFIGIRTPWTLSSDAVWDKTHKIGGKLFKLSGIITLFGIFVPKYAFILIMVSVFSATIYSLIYSYIQYLKERKQKLP